MLEILEIVIKSAAFVILILLCFCWNDAYRAGRNDERDEQIQRRQGCADHTIPMDHTHGGEDD